MIYKEYIELLQKMIRTPSLSKEEAAVSTVIANFLLEQGVVFEKYKNNIWAKSKHFDPTKKNLLLNSHMDTVRPNSGYTIDPFCGEIKKGKIFGLGSNDAGASVVSLTATFINFYDKVLPFNLILAITAEEECSGHDGIEALLERLPKIDLAIVGEPTQMQMAIGERGLLVLDCVALGEAGHAAREEGQNAIYKAIKDIEWFKNYRFEKVSELFGPVKMNVTVINAGSLHNMIPERCEFVVDIRVPEIYRFEEVLETIHKNVTCDIKPRSTRLRPSKIDTKHPLIQAGLEMGRETYGSPTTSDAALINGVEVLKMGVGESARSHSADEFVFVDEIEKGIPIYIELLERFANRVK